MRRATSRKRVDLNALLMFHGIASTGSLTRAAAKLDVPKATLSRQLRALERELDALLVKRAHGRLELTDAGAALYARTQTLAADVDDVAEYAHSLRNELEGVLRIAVPTGFMGALCGKAVLRFALMHPHVRLHVQQTDRPVDVIREPVDVLVHVGSSPGQSAPTRVLARIRRGAYASPAYLRTHPAPAHPRDLATHDCIALASQQLGGVWPMIEGHAGDAVAAGRTSLASAERRAVASPDRSIASTNRPTTSTGHTTARTDRLMASTDRFTARADRTTARAVVSDIHLAREMALAGLGIAVLPEALCRDDVAAGRLQRVLPDWRIPLGEVSATYAERRHLPAKVRRFLDLLQAEFANLVSEERGRSRSGATLAP